MNVRFRHKILGIKFFFILIFFSLCLNAQPELKFARYTIDNGLAHNDVLSICQDTLGFLWFGTKYGCSRFDGIEFKTYQYDENVPGSIGSGWVNQIICDSKNRLWFAIAGQENAFMRYDYETDKFTDLSAYIKNKDRSDDVLFNCWSIYLDNDEYIWFRTTYSTTAYYNPGTHKANFSVQKLLNDASMKGAITDSAQNMWFATDLGLFFYNRKTTSFTQYKHDPNNPQSICSDNCSCIFQGSDGTIWIGTYEGLNKLILTSSGKFVFERFVYDAHNTFSLSHNHIFNINEDVNKNLFIATLNGLSVLDKRNKKFYRYYNKEADNESINSNLVRVVFRDKQDNMWIGTSSGVGKLKIENFKSFSHSSIKNSISHNKVQYICEGPNTNVWIATPRGIDVFNRETGKFDFKINIIRNDKGLYGAPIFLYSDDNKGMWIGTWNGGVGYFNYKNNKITNHVVDSFISDVESVFFIFRDSKNNLWLGTHRLKGVYVYNEKSGEYKVFKFDNESGLIGVRSIVEDSESNIWIGTLKGLNLLVDFEKEIFKRYLEETGINQIFEDSNKNLWVATDKGLYRFNRKLDKFERINLPSNNVFGVLEDSSRNIYVSSGKGLIKLDSLENITQYRKEEGLSIGNFIEHSCVKLSDGTMMFGGTEGFCMFNPSSIKTDTIPPKVIFTGLEVANKVVRVGQKIEGQILLEKSMEIMQHIVFNHKNNAFTIEFSGLQYNLPQYIQYCYTLEGYDSDNEWHYTGITDRRAEYMNLPHGTYAFKVKAANSYGIWGKTAELKITILPPWWRTIWFICLLISLMFFFIFLYIKWRTYNLVQHKKELEKVVEQRTTELKEMNLILVQKQEQLHQQIKKTEEIAQQLHEADQSKLRFFANVSHEFRTPLSLIIGPLEKMVSFKQPILWNKINISDYHRLMLKNSKRLLRLINQVIDFRKIEQGNNKLTISNNNIVEFAQDIADAFSPLAEQKSIVLKVQSQLPIIDSWFDPDIMEKILFNLISNAIKYTPEEGEVSVQLSVNNEQSTENSEQKTVNSNQSYDSPLNTDNCLLITVKDTGIGIKEENLDKIFDRFYREESDENYTIEGTGIGLAYTKELVELHKGSIKVESELCKGTSFILQFPMEKESFGNNIVTKETTQVNLEYTRSMIDSGEETNKKNLTTNIIEGQDKNKQTILIVEDNVDLRNFIKNELQEQYNILEANNGEKGLEIAEKKEPHFIVSDIMMPVMNGIELCKRIKTNENTSHIPVILLTAREGDKNEIQGLRTGAEDYITKPFNVNVLKIKIENILSARKKIQEKFRSSIDVHSSELAHSNIDEEFMQKAVKIVNENMRDYNFDNDGLVSLMNSSRSLVYAKIRSLTGQSVGEFIRTIRLKAAAQLFLNQKSSVSEVCYKVGFKNPSVLTRHFTKMFGVPPVQFMKNKTGKY